MNDIAEVNRNIICAPKAESSPPARANAGELFHPVTEVMHSYVTRILKAHNVYEVIDIGGVGKLNGRFVDVCNSNLKDDIDGCCLPYDDGSFQASVSIATLEHVHDQVGFLKEAIRVARDISVHWFPFGPDGERIERFKTMIGHIHQCVVPKIEVIAEALSGCHYEVIPFVTCKEHLLCLASLYPRLNRPELYNFMFDNSDAYIGAILKIYTKRK